MKVGTSGWARIGGAVLVGLGGLALAPGGVAAHFFLESPESWREQGILGDPQKTGPCGNEGTAAETGAITAYQTGQTITITIRETIYHPGHYRVALAVADRSELPPVPDVTPGSTDCGSVPIMDPPVFPVLADGLLPHTSPLTGEQTMEVTLPEGVTCDHCTLQIVEWMAEHGAPCFYYHCADISISDVVVDAGTAETDAGTTEMDAGTVAIDAGTPPPPASTSSCAAAGHGEGAGGAAAVGLGALALVLARRRRSALRVR
jgi:hypothetical protein